MRKSILFLFVLIFFGISLFSLAIMTDLPCKRSKEHEECKIHLRYKRIDLYRKCLDSKKNK